MKQLAPIPDGFASVIATRSFDLIEAGVTFKFVIEIGMPAQDVETVVGMDWRPIESLVLPLGLKIFAVKLGIC